MDYPRVPTEQFELLNTLGKFEMEEAMRVMLPRIIQEGSWEVDFGISAFQNGDPNHKAETGFLWLLQKGWMDEGDVSPCFRASPELAQHLMKLRDVEVERRHLVD